VRVDNLCLIIITRSLTAIQLMQLHRGMRQQFSKFRLPAVSRVRDRLFLYDTRLNIQESRLGRRLEETQVSLPIIINYFWLIMSKKVTYFLGAGASANTLPVVAYMQQRMEEIILYCKAISRRFADLIEHDEIHEADRRLFSLIGVLNQICNDLEWVTKEAGNYYTIDTLAKKFYLTDDNRNLAKLKKCLITYFTFEQVLFVESSVSTTYKFKKHSIDKRYSSFIAAITNKQYPIAGINPNGLAAENLGFEINKNIKILSWNYDVQFEMSLQQFSKTVLNHIKSELQILPNEESKSEVNNVIVNTNRFAMIKLNGDAMWNKLPVGLLKACTIFDGIRHTNKSDELLADFLDEYKKRI
jgi:hypothetical protein